MMQVVPGCPERSSLIEKLISAPPDEDRRCAMLRSQLRIEPALQVVQVVTGLMRWAQPQERLEAERGVSRPLDELAVAGFRDQAREAALVHVGADGIVVETGELWCRGRSCAVLWLPQAGPQRDPSSRSAADPNRRQR